MLYDLDESLKKLLIEEVPLDPREIELSFEQPKRDWSQAVGKPTLNLYFYDLRQNLQLREEMNVWILEQDKREGTGIKRKMPARIDVSYFITAWTQNSEDEHRLLWRTLEALIRFRELPEQYQCGELQGQIVPTQIRCAQGDGVMKNPAEFWSSLDNQLRPSINLSVTLPILDYRMEELRPLTLVRQHRLKIYNLKGQVQEERRVQLNLMGVVRSRESCLEGALITLEPMEQSTEKNLVQSMTCILDSLRKFPLRALTDNEGFFYFLRLNPGPYQLEVTAKDHVTLTKNITLRQGEEKTVDIVLKKNN